ncbi:hypothetical protein GCM10023188_27560 [Pontibacter saemangeumensis]|uniref:NUMOD4 domain-containing protein n=1 Tax=Pontibacter saemangeumensis TaxID=1084525 RepID=A0ABP8LVF0_9BACT
MEEIYKDIKGYEGFYQVSDTGKVISLSYKRTGKPRELKQSISDFRHNVPFAYVSLSRGGKARPRPVAFLVAEAFLRREAGKGYIIHLNHNTTDNRVENIIRATEAEFTIFIQQVSGRDSRSRRGPYFTQKREISRRLDHVLHKE